MRFRHPIVAGQQYCLRILREDIFENLRIERRSEA